MRTRELKDRDSIVLHGLLKYYLKCGHQHIKRARLLDLTGPNGSKMAPATFQRSLKRLESRHVLHCKKIENTTYIIFSIKIVKNSLKKKKENPNLEFQNITEQIEPEAWQSLLAGTANEIAERITSAWGSLENNELRYGEHVTKKAISGIVSLIMSHCFEVFILQKSWNKVRSERKQAIEDLIRAVGRFTKGYPNEEFTMTIYFNGFEQTLDKVSNELYAPIIQEITPFLLMFSEHVLNYRFSKQDKFLLRCSRIDSLSAPARKCFDIFLKRITTLIPKSMYNDELKR